MHICQSQRPRVLTFTALVPLVLVYAMLVPCGAAAQESSGGADAITVETPLRQRVAQPEWITQLIEGGVASRILEQHAPKMAVWETKIDDADMVLQAVSSSDDELRELPEVLAKIKDEIAKFITSLKSKREDLEQQLKKLGPEPKDVEPVETGGVAGEWRKLKEQLGAIDGLIKRSDVYLIRIAQIVSASNVKRRERFSTRLLTRVPNLFGPDLWSLAFWSRARFFEKVEQGFVTVTTRLKSSSWQVILALVLLPILFAGFLIYRFRKIEPFQPAGEQTSRFSGQGAVIMRTSLHYFIPFAAIIGTFFAVAAWADIPAPGSERHFINVTLAALAAGFLGFLVHANIAYFERMSGQDNTEYQLLKFLVIALVVLWFVDELTGNMIKGLQATYSFSVITTFIFAMLYGFCLVAVLVTLRRMGDAKRIMVFDGWRGILYVVGLALVATLFVSAFSGYIALARFTGSQVVATGGILYATYMLHLVIDYYSTKRLFAGQEGAPSNFVGDADQGGHAATLGTLRVLTGLSLDILLLLFAIPFLLLQWGFDWTEVRTWIVQAFWGVQFGGFTLSLKTVLVAIGFFAGGVLITRIVQRWISNRLSYVGRTDTGLRTSVYTIIGYTGFVLSLLLAASYLGIDFTKIAIIAGALSVGIGFGLQSIFNNFVSGLILLLERPIKVGDWIMVDGNEGYVRRINVRATEIETVNKEAVIIPNSVLISGTVKNWMHRDRTCRLDINIGVSYKSDLGKVRDVLLEVAKNHPEVLPYPESVVYFKDYGESSLDLELRVFLPDVINRVRIMNELRFEIWDALKRNNIEIPFPQRDIHIKGSHAETMTRAETKLEDS